MNEELLNRVYQEFGGLTEGQATQKLQRDYGIVLDNSDSDDRIPKLWKNQLIWLCEGPEKEHVYMPVIEGPMRVVRGEYDPKAKVSVKHVVFETDHRGFAYWIPDVVEGEPGNGYWTYYRWYGWVEKE